MKKEKLKTISFLFCTIILMACSGKNIQEIQIDGAGNAVYKDVVNSSEIQIRYIPEQYSLQKDLLTVEASVNVPENLNLDAVPTGKAEIKLLNVDKITEDLAAGIDVKEVMEEEEDGNEDMDSFINQMIYFQDGSSLNINPTYLSFVTPLTYYIDHAFWEEEGVDFYNANVYKNRELSFAKPDEAYAEIKNRLEQWGIEIGEQYEYFGLNHRILEQEEYPIGDEGIYDASLKKEVWNEEDDCYYFYCGQELQRIPIYYYGYGMLRGNHNIGSAIKVKYGKKGFVEVVINRPYIIQDTGESVYAISPEEAVDCLVQKFDNIILTDPVVIDEISLQMLPQRVAQGIYELTPVWIFEGDVYMTFDDGTQDSVRDKYMFDAVTGKEIIL